MYSLDTLKSEYIPHQEVILFYKTNQCPSITQDVDSDSKSANRLCFGVSCFHYHHIHEIRRSVFDEQNNTLFYDASPCAQLQGGLSCSNGVRCTSCHTQNEMNYHPFFYKTEPCTNCMHSNNIQLCPFYHQEEINRKGLVDKMFSINDEGMNQNQFNLDFFKVKPCMKKGNHNLKVCPYHHDKDRRRPTNIYMYTPPMCQYILRKENCPNGENCRYSHNKLEQLYHPERYKRKFCHYYPHNIDKCDYEDFCSFAHNESQILIDLLHNIKQDTNFYLYKYKTVFCPYIYEHDRNQCVYAHNPQDLRRDPNQFKYNPVQCIYWSQGQIFNYEEGGCPKQMECKNCHGWKELEYHPLYYKTKPCNNGKKCNKKDCPFYHSTAEKRTVKTNNQVTSSLTRSLLSANNNIIMGSPVSPIQIKPFGSEPQQSFEKESYRFLSEKKASDHIPKPSVSPFNFSKSNDLENMKRYELKQQQQQKRFPDSSSGMGSFIPSTNFTEDELTLTMSSKPRAQNQDFTGGRPFSMNSAETCLETSKFDLSRSLFSQPLNLWSSFQPYQDDKLDDFIKSIPKQNEQKFDYGFKEDQSFESTASDGQEKNEAAVERTSSLNNDSFKKAFKSNLERKGLSHTVQYLTNPLIDIKALKNFNQKDFHLFPYISNEDKEKVVKIIQDVLDEEALLSEVNTIHECECQNNLTTDGEGFCKIHFQDPIYNLTSQLDRLSY